jgi:hypothetical protein
VAFVLDVLSWAQCCAPSHWPYGTAAYGLQLQVAALEAFMKLTTTVVPQGGFAWFAAHYLLQLLQECALQ